MPKSIRRNINVRGVKRSSWLTLKFMELAFSMRESNDHIPLGEVFDEVVRVAAQSLTPEERAALKVMLDRHEGGLV